MIKIEFFASYEAKKPQVPISGHQRSGGRGPAGSLSPPAVNLTRQRWGCKNKNPQTATLTH